MCRLSSRNSQPLCMCATMCCVADCFSSEYSSPNTLTCAFWPTLMRSYSITSLVSHHLVLQVASLQDTLADASAMQARVQVEKCRVLGMNIRHEECRCKCHASIVTAYEPKWPLIISSLRIIHRYKAYETTSCITFPMFPNV